MTSAPTACFRAMLPVLMAAALVLAPLSLLSASAQGPSRFDSMLDDAHRFLDRQLEKLDDNLPRRGAVPSTGVPVPPRNPRRGIELAQPNSQPLQPIQPPERPEPRQPDQQIGGAQPRLVPPAPAEPAEPEKPASTAEGLGAASPELQDAEDGEETASAEPGPDLPIRNPARIGEYTPPPPHPSEIEAPDWTEKQIADAKARCDELLSDETLKFEPLDPIRTGICGTPAPVKLSSLEAGATVTIAPAATLTCPLAAALRRWIREVVQPAAKEHLGSPIASVRNVASYACRNRYGGARRPLSEHAKVNAIDIAAFKTESGETVILLEHWNLMIEPEPPVAPTEPENSADKGSAPDDSGEDAETGKEASPGDGEASLTAKSSDDSSESKEEKNSDDKADAKPESEEPPVPQAKPKPHPKSLFLREIHAGACGFFGTVLGPDSNSAHRDHFHFDAAERRKSYCE